MIPAVWHKLDQGARIALPLVTTLAFALLGVVKWPMPYFGEVAPPLALIAIYYWTSHRPDLFGPGAAFAAGLLNDILNLPARDIGISALVFVGAQQLVLVWRRFFAGHSFLMMWWGFAAVMLAAGFSEWALLCLWHWEGMPLLPVMLQALLAIVLFPLPCWALIRLQRAAFAGT